MPHRRVKPESSGGLTVAVTVGCDLEFVQSHIDLPVHSHVAEKVYLVDAIEGGMRRHIVWRWCLVLLLLGAGRGTQGQG
jgi:hypothetical protein